MQKIIDLLSSPWAMQSKVLEEIQSIYSTHLKGEKIDFEAIEKKLGKPLENSQKQYVIDKGVAVLAIDGMIAPKANLFTRVCGGASSDLIVQQIEGALADRKVDSILLVIDSPGGSVFGVAEAAKVIKEAAATKPIVTVSDANLASAAYWIGSSANAVYITGPVVNVGSIGVVATHNYRPNSNAQTTEIVAGAYKRMATSSAPLTEDGKAYLQDQVDQIYQVFVDAVADNLGTTADHVLTSMADGKIFIGQKAIDAGLVHGMASIDELITEMSANPQKFANRFGVKKIDGSAPSKTKGAKADAGAQLNVANETNEVKTMDIEELKAKHPELYAQVQAASASQASAAETKRVQDVMAQSMPGHEALIETMVKDGKTTGPEAAVAVLAAVKAANAKTTTAEANAINTFKADAPNPVVGSVPGTEGNASSKEGEKSDKAKLVASAKKIAAEQGIPLVKAYALLGVK